MLGKLLKKLVKREGSEEDLLDELFRLGVPYEIAERILELSEGKALEDILSSLFPQPWDLVAEAQEKKPYKLLFVGPNGVGKTTTIAKIAFLLKKFSILSVLCASDTFRAGSIEQLEIHGKNLGLPVIKHSYGADPAAVAFDAVKYAEKRGFGAVLIDTAGRNELDRNLMAELEKIKRVVSPHRTILVLDATTGNSLINQALSFSQIGIDGIIFAKADLVRSKGFLFLSPLIQAPVLFLGTGESYSDLIPFRPKEFFEEICSERI